MIMLFVSIVMVIGVGRLLISTGDEYYIPTNKKNSNVYRSGVIMKYVIIFLALFMLVSCSIENTPNERDGHMYWTPDGAKLIKQYTMNGGESWWMKWSLDGECFLSYGLGNREALLTKVNCAQ